MMSLEDEISHLQKENSRIESQLSRMKGDVSSAETEAVSEDKVRILKIPRENIKIEILQDQNELKRKNAKLTDYYENLRTNVFSIFGSSHGSQNYSDSYLGLFVSEIQLFVLSSQLQHRKKITTFLGSKTMLKGAEADNMSQERYDNYLTKLQNICTENVGEEGKPVYETMKSAIQNMSALPTQRNEGGRGDLVKSHLCIRMNTINL